MKVQESLQHGMSQSWSFRKLGSYQLLDTELGPGQKELKKTFPSLSQSGGRPARHTVRGEQQPKSVQGAEVVRDSD